MANVISSNTNIMNNVNNFSNNSNNNFNITLMAFATGKASTSAVSFPRYIGIAATSIVAINPTKAETEKILGYTPAEEPNYIGTQETSFGTVRSARIDIILKADPTVKGNEGMAIDKPAFFHLNFFINEAFRRNRDNTKCQVIDKYGRTAWVTEKELKDHAIPVSSKTGAPLMIDADYRPILTGEEELTQFFINFLSIPSLMVWNRDTKVWERSADKPEDCEARFDINKVLTGDFSEIRNAWKAWENNLIKVMIGLRNRQDGGKIQTIFTRKFLRNAAPEAAYTAIGNALAEAKAAGALSTSEFEATPIHEYVVTASPIPAATNAPSPFDDNAANPFA